MKIFIFFVMLLTLIFVARARSTNSSYFSSKSEVVPEVVEDKTTMQSSAIEKAKIRKEDEKKKLPHKLHERRVDRMSPGDFRPDIDHK